MGSIEQLAVWQGEAENRLLPLLQALQAALQSGNPEPTRLLRLIELAALQASEPAATDSTASTLSQLVRVQNLRQVAKGVGVKISADRSRILAQRALEVLSGRSEAYISPYTRLAAQVLVYDGFRGGAQAGAQMGGARYKTFTRLRPVREPRPHSVLEGVTIPVDELFNIGGTMAYGPGDARLPWSERAWCGHILKFSR